MDIVRNERVKLLAAALNTGATSSVTVGILAPMAAAYYNIGSSAVSPRTVIFGGFLWFAGAAVLHLAARHVLRGLTP